MLVCFESRQTIRCFASNRIAPKDLSAAGLIDGVITHSLYEAEQGMVLTLREVGCESLPLTILLNAWTQLVKHSRGAGDQIN